MMPLMPCRAQFSSPANRYANRCGDAKRFINADPKDAASGRRQKRRIAHGKQLRLIGHAATNFRPSIAEDK
jgi:hypothetical protein